jgi:uncharacterized lipoprotein YajG
MKRIATCLCGLLLSTACSTREEAPQSTPAPTPPAAQPAAPDVEAPAIPSQAELDAKAAAAISKENADAELEKLKKELGGG